MSNFPTGFDDDATLPPINDNLEEEGPEAINALREAVFNIENNIGLNANGSTASIATRFDVSFLASGAIKPSVLTGAGLVTLPITNSQIAPAAGITESKLALDYSTQALYNFIQDLGTTANANKSWISLTGAKLDPHIAGTSFYHYLSHILVSSNTAQYFKNKFVALRNNANSFTMLDDLNSDLVQHQRADGTGTSSTVTTISGATYPSSFSHYAGGIYVNTNTFSTIPHTANSLQDLLTFIDTSSLLLLGSRTQNLYANGIPRSARSQAFTTNTSGQPVDGYGQAVVPATSAIAYLLNTGLSLNPFDDISTGDDIVEFKPSAADMLSSYFDSKFANVRPGDILRINYGTVQVSFLIKEKKYIQSLGNKKYFVRIAGKNLSYSPNALARIDKPNFNTNKFGVLAVAQAHNNFAQLPSLIVGNPRGAQTLGLGFDPDKFDADHYMLYLALYTTGNPVDGYTILPGIDITGNAGATPGKYTLQSIVEATNNKLRDNGYNYRFIAFSYKGEFGIMLADPYHNSAFSILNGIVTSLGVFDQPLTESTFPKNVVGLFSATSKAPPDPLGFGSSGANVASPPFLQTYASPEASLFPTKLFISLSRNNYYVNGAEKSNLTLEKDQLVDGYGDGYWDSTVVAKNTFPGVGGRVQTTYRVYHDLSSVQLKIGKTLVCQSLGTGTLLNFGRFIIESVSCNDCNTLAPYTDITVYDAVHATALSPSTTFAVGSRAALYFDSDSVSFNQENSSDFTSVSPFRRSFEVYINQDGYTFTHERARINISGSTMTVNSQSLYGDSELNKINIVKVSHKLRGYDFGVITKITLNISSYVDSTTLASGFSGFLAYYDGVNYLKNGPLTFGRKGQVVRFYDETNIDYIDFKFDENVSVADFTSKNIDIQLFPSLSLDDEVMLIATCQLDDTSKKISYLTDDRQFGNTSEKHFTTSALDYISLPEKLLHSNGVIRGFDLEDRVLYPNPDESQIFLTGGMCLVNGKLINVNNGIVNIPRVMELFVTNFDINWAICVNSIGEYQPIPLLDPDYIFPTPTLTTRTMKVFNPVAGNTYYVDSTTFKNLVDNRKDLCPLYIVPTNVNPVTPFAMTISEAKDVRKFVNDSDTNLPLRYRTTSSFGNFQSVEAIFNYLKFNPTLTGQIFLRGATLLNSTINSRYYFDFQNLVVVDGENNAAIQFTSQFPIFGSNITFKNMSIRIVGINFIQNSTNITFENCNFTCVGAVSFPLTGCKNVKFIDCTFTATYSAPANGSHLFVLQNCENVDFIRNTVNMTYNLTPGTYTPGQLMRLYGSKNVTVKDCTLTGNFSSAIVIAGISSLNQSKSNIITNNTITSTYDPSIGPDFGYDSTDFVNSATNGFVLVIPQDTDIDDVVITNNLFNYTPTIPSNNRFCFVNVSISLNTTTLSNFNISNNRFSNTNLPSTLDDVRPAVAIINNVTYGGLTLPKYPTIKNFLIENNIGTKNQSIIITSNKNISSGHMEGPGLVAQNVIVRNNNMGTIGYWVSADKKTLNLPTATNLYNDRSNGLTIEENICHYITNFDSKGKFFSASKYEVVPTATINQSDYPSGNVLIRNNKCNWIHVSIAYEQNSSLRILDNQLSAYDATFQIQFETGYNTAIAVYSNKHVTPTTQTPPESNDSPVVISGNITEIGYWVILPSTISQYKYEVYLTTYSSATVTRNIFKGVDSSTTGVGVVSFGGKRTIFTNNSVYTYNKNGSYLIFYNDTVPTWDGEGSYGLVVDNFFDTSVALRNISGGAKLVPPTSTISTWTFERNINQTAYASIPINPTDVYSLGVMPVFGGNFDIHFAASSSAYPATPLIPVDSTGYRSNVISIKEAAGITRNLGWQENLAKYLPTNVRLTKIYVDVKVFETPVVLTSSNVFFILNKYEKSYSYTTSGFSTFTSEDSNITNATTAPYMVVTGSEINTLVPTFTYSFTTKTIDLIPSNVSYDYITGKDYDMSISMDFHVITDTAQLKMLISPIMIEYTW